jgi:hypothetical protein
MSHSFLPVNPCCTDVVLNAHCECTNCNNNLCGTNVTLSSNVLYNGPILTCTTIEPCDNLNVVLQKVDEVICNLLSQINTLTTQVNTLTVQIVNINSDVININNTLGTCCPTTTTTTTI